MREPDELLDVPVQGGDLRVARWGDGDRVVVAVHGVTANHRNWAVVAERLPDDISLYAPDLRGRGASARLPGPWGLRQHAADTVAILDHLGVDEAVFAGHSMGAFVVALAAEEHPDRVRRLVLIDGGLPLPIEWPEGMDTEQKTRAVIGPALDRLGRTFGSVEDYLDYWRPHPAVSEGWGDAVEAYLRYDIEETDDGWRSKVDREAILGDSEDTIVDETTSDALHRIETPAVLLLAPRGILNQVPGLYPPEYISEVGQQLPHVRTRFVEDVNHYTIAFLPRGADAVAEEIREAVGASVS